MTTMLMHVAERMFGRPLLCMPEKVEIILGVLGGRVGIEDINAPIDPLASRFAGRKSDSGPYRITREGIAIIPVIGTLVNRGAYIGASSGLTSYEGLTEQIKRAASSSDVRGIVLDIDSPGGEAAGTFEVAALVRDVRKTKRVVAVVNDMACSAAYAIASAANEIHVTQTGLVGSVGVVLVHYDRSRALEMAGVRPTIIHAGARKVDGNPFGALPAEVKERFRSDAEQVRELFIATVVAGRPRLKPEDVRATEAGVFMGQDAIKVGLADAIYSSFDAVLDGMNRSLSKSVHYGPTHKHQMEVEMSDNPAPATPTQTASQTPAPATTSVEDARAQARADERARLKAIRELPEAKERQALATHLATETDLSVDAVKSALATAPKETSGAGGNSFYEAVAKTGGTPEVPGVGESSGVKRESFSAWAGKQRA